MASKAAKSGIALLGLGALLLLAGGASAEPKKEQPAPGPKPLPSGDKCVRTQPGDGPGNGKEAAVRAWQKCLVAAGCLAPDGVDGRHDVITEGASKLYEASGGKGCAEPYKPAKPGPADATSKKVTYRLLAQTAKDGKPKTTEIDSTVLTAPIKKADEQAVLQAFGMESDNWFGDHADEGPGVGVVLKNDGKKTSQLWSREYGQGKPSGGSMGSSGSAGGLIV